MFATLLMLLLVVGLSAVVYLLLQLSNRLKYSKAEEGSLSLIQQQMDALRRETVDALGNTVKASDQRMTDLTHQFNQRLSEIDRSLRDTTGQVSTRLDSAVRVIRDVSATMGELSKASQQIFDVGRDISSLQNILRAPKLRGVIGELFLGNLLQQVVPGNYELQYRFRSGEIVDAIIRLGPKFVPIDAKFPLENFQRLNACAESERASLRRKFVADLTKHVDAIAAKYIVPDEGTYDFALMYIPAENVYYEAIIRDSVDEASVADYAISKRVVPVSPNSLYAYLQAIVFGLRGMQIEKRAQDILSHLGRLQQEFLQFHEDFELLGTHLSHARNKYEDAARRAVNIEGKLSLGVDMGELSDHAGSSRREEAK